MYSTKQTREANTYIEWVREIMNEQGIKKGNWLIHLNFIVINQSYFKK